MKVSQLAEADSIIWSPSTKQLLDKSHFSLHEVEEALLNFPKIQKITLKFSDQNERFYVEGLTDLGKKIRLVIFIRNHKIQITFIAKG